MLYYRPPRTPLCTRQPSADRDSQATFRAEPDRLRAAPIRDEPGSLWNELTSLRFLDDPHGARRARYRGLPKTRLDHVYMAAALNLLRLEAFWTGTPLDRRRTSHLTRLELGLVA